MRTYFLGLRVTQTPPVWSQRELTHTLLVSDVHLRCIGWLGMVMHSR